MPLDLKKLQAQFAPLLIPAAIGGALAYHWKEKSYPAAALGAVAGALVGSLIMPSLAKAKTPAIAAPVSPTPEPEYAIDRDRAQLVRSEADRRRVQLRDVGTLPRALQYAMTDEAWARYWDRRLARHPEDRATMIAIAQERGRRFNKGIDEQMAEEA